MTLARVAVAVVHHANQHLIGDGYDNRQGITEIAHGYERVLDAHARAGVHAGLHLSGTLIEVLEWHVPALLDRVRAHVADGLITPIGGTYAENVMTLFADDVNRRQLHEWFWLCGRHLGCDPESVTLAWVPERVWNSSVGRAIADPSLPNGGYRAALLDDRHLIAPRDRAAFDRAGPFRDREATVSPDTCRPWAVDDCAGLAVVPISAPLRYWVPAREPADRDRLDVLAKTLAGEDALIVYGDDLEKTAGVGGWEPVGDAFDDFLLWLADPGGPARPVDLIDWLDEHSPMAARPVAAGTFYELACQWDAGDDYSGWAGHPDWAVPAAHIAGAELALRKGRGGDERLLDLGWKHYMASCHETAWRDQVGGGNERQPARWAVSAASHARSCLPMARAAWAMANPVDHPMVFHSDIDRDGSPEVVLQTGSAMAIISPRFGGRVVALFHLTESGGALSIGNPSDHWNFQVELNRYMDIPANHPGALADRGGEHDVFRVLAIAADEHAALVRMVSEGPGRPGLEKSVGLMARTTSVVACYRTEVEVPTAVCLSPDYLTLLREGRGGLRCLKGTGSVGVGNGEVDMWVAADPTDGSLVTCDPEAVGHGVTVVASGTGHFHVAITACGRGMTPGLSDLHGDITALHGTGSVRP